MSADEAIENWYAQRLRDFYAASYRAYVSSASEAAYPSEAELSSSAAQADLSDLPGEVRAAYDFYRHHFEDADIGSARIYIVVVGAKPTYAARVKTDGDDGYLEIYDDEGTFLAAGRTYIEVVAWGSRAWLRAQVGQLGALPPELHDAPARTLWGKPLSEATIRLQDIGNRG